MNRDEAQKCIEISTRKLAAGDVQGAVKFATKAASLHDSPEVQALLKKIAATPAGASSGTTSSASTSSSANSTTQRPAVNREHTQPKREYTAEQEVLVKRVRKCNHTAFYEILAVKKESTDSEIKKAYRKLALQLHPDKNGAPGADEAFKMVSRAFQILSDEGKREQFDRYGADPDSRQAAPSGFSQQSYGRGGMQGQGNMFGDELNADDLFNMFFGGGGMGGQGGFGAGSPFVSFGGPGVRMHQFGGQANRQQRRAGGQGQATPANWMQLLPLIILFGFSVLSSLFSSGESFFSGSSPSYSFQRESPYISPRYTPNHKIPYWVDPAQVASVSAQNLAQLDKKAEHSYIRNLRDNCEYEYQDRERRMNDAYGFFSVDKQAYNAAKNMKLNHCETLKKYGYRT
ncbi:Uncharacterized J domain-containing protein C17A3.05c [Taphrina deformans PYCC 5710]|uniref:Uncharacterized J domain-containing protein C17A3.05c n=1 Tax=Taphrina deformans (strain PYCC 5710 / ATCC 11124 / CBS 356.35 / IMI 108563 / JCM 9778 / NBRC 8474) TaxID=1097556 RepID=R4XA17_TAPDE|nr:Uncharacterized J domain-containing protein C17A3.05c [Taphrina deformans PYCC 5710]|eukprot:CCG82628.1 Uncharacterized J domain-containing protein C17A3.05c [Taphrina deformans PYCC 5710]